MDDARVPPIALVDWEDEKTLVAVADGASGLVRPEPPVPVEHQGSVKRPPSPR